jgi:capsular polysaccharide transport system ATP-binding protein
MISLKNVSVLKPGFFHRDPVLLNATATFGARERVGILARPGTGKSSIARMLCGIDQPDSGTIERSGRISWPIGFAGFLHPQLKVGENIEYFARLVGVSASATARFCVDFCRIVDLLDRKMQDMTPTQRALLSYACSLSVDYPSMWIADEVITVGEPHERARCDEILKERLSSGGLILVSRNIRQLGHYCDRHYVLLNCQLLPCDDLVAAQNVLEQFSANAISPVKEFENV